MKDDGTHQGHLWVSATATRNYMLRNPLVDWLDLYGDANGHTRDTDLPSYEERLEFVPFIMQKGREFEAAVLAHLGSRSPIVTVAQTRDDIRNPGAAARTFEALAEGLPIIHQAVLRDAETLTYGAPDLLIRSDVFEELFPGHLAPGESTSPAPELGSNSWHYVVVDVKFTTLHLLAGGQIGNSNRSPAHKAQLCVYNDALGRLQGYTPPTAFLLGRGWDQTVKGVKSRCSNALERLGPVAITDDVRWQVDTACDWVRRVRTQGAEWSPLPSPTVPELWPNAGEDGFPWAGAIKSISSDLDELTQLWYVGPDKRDAAHRAGIFSWRDVRATASVLDITGSTTQPTLQAILDVNRTESGPAVQPPRVQSAESEWRPVPNLEFFVDFETVNNVNDDFTRFPEQNGQNLIFMIGCGHMANGEWTFRSFCADHLAEEGEERMIDEWLTHMSEVRLAHDPGGAPRLIHWSYAEPVNYEEAYDSARERHPEKGWPQVNWFDLWAKVVRKEPVVVRGALNFGLKSFARAMHSNGLIDTSWGDSRVDGLGAMTGAWWCDEEAVENECGLIDIGLMQEIAAYNEVDCRVMQEILDHLRINH